MTTARCFLQVNIDEKDESGCTGLHYAILYKYVLQQHDSGTDWSYYLCRHFPCIQILVDNNARLDLNFEDLSLAHLVVRVAKIPRHEEFCDKTLRLLVARGADIATKVHTFLPTLVRTC